MYLRKLKMDDALYMIEWMHDKTIVENMHADFISMSIIDCKRFINNSINKENINLAISDDNDLYMGTVSLKNIKDFSAEFAIVIRRIAMGQGYSIFAMKEILKYAFYNLKLESVYWCVSPNNIRALRFYDKNGFQRVAREEVQFIENVSQKVLIWYVIKKNMWDVF